MQKIIAKIPAYILALVAFMSIALLNLAITKVVFYITNSASFSHITISDIFFSWWFDLITVTLTFVIFIPLWLFPVKIRANKFYFLFFRILFFLINGISVALNLIDVVYFEYTSKRSTLDLFSMIGYGDDISQLWTSFLKDFWWLVVIFILILITSDFLFKKVYRYLLFNEKVHSIKKQIIAFVCAVPIVIVLARGGIGLKPVGVINAAQYTQPENVAFLLNTTFTMIKSFENEQIKEKDYFTPEKLQTIFSARKVVESDTNYQLSPKTNVVIIILESFGDEWVGKTNHGISYTPFLDSLIDQSYFFSNSFANGKKSIEGIPAVIAGIPSLMDNPYITSNYSGNKIIGLGNIMQKHGYSTSFYHGATNGSMNFDGFSALVGFENYIGRTEYNNEKDNDGTWGIFDHKFLPWAANQMSDSAMPFCNVIFTLSSHHPYKVPEEFEGKLKKGPEPLCQSINYSDNALRLFFEAAKKQPWFEHTIFVLTADHTSASNNEIYNHRIGMYKIPILFYDPSKKLPAKTDERIFQQIDIYPTLLGLLGWKDSVYCIGSSAFDNRYKRFAVNYLEGTYQLFEDNFVLTYNNENQEQLYNFKQDLLMKKDSLTDYPKKSQQMEQFLEGIIQTFNYDLIYNRNHCKITDETKNTLYHQPNFGRSKKESNTSTH